MIAVFEEINGDYAVFIIEDLSETYSLNLSKLPENSHPGDLFEVRINEWDEIELGVKLKEERERREKRNRLKREALKRRKLDQ